MSEPEPNLVEVWLDRPPTLAQRLLPVCGVLVLVVAAVAWPAVGPWGLIAGAILLAGTQLTSVVLDHRPVVWRLVATPTELLALAVLPRGVTEVHRLPWDDLQLVRGGAPGGAFDAPERDLELTWDGGALPLGTVHPHSPALSLPDRPEPNEDESDAPRRAAEHATGSWLLRVLYSGAAQQDDLIDQGTAIRLGLGIVLSLVSLLAYVLVLELPPGGDVVIAGVNLVGALGVVLSLGAFTPPPDQRWHLPVLAAAWSLGVLGVALVVSDDSYVRNALLLFHGVALPVGGAVDLLRLLRGR